MNIKILPFAVTTLLIAVGVIVVIAVMNVHSDCKHCSLSAHEFAFDLYKQLRKEAEKSNIFFSPYSIITTMEIVYEGARGTTAQELATSLSLQKNVQKRRAGSKSLFDILHKSNAPYTLSTANALWIDQDFKILAEYHSNAQTWYNAAINNVDFQHDSAQAEHIINAWVNQQTKGMIKTILEPNSLNALTRLVVTNAIYFKGKWSEPFNKQQTQQEAFFVNENTQVHVAMMHAVQDYAYTENDSMQMLELPYAGDDLSMIIVLPKEKNSKQLEQELNSKNFVAWKQELAKQKVNVHIPRITLDTSYGLVETCKHMGVHQAFDQNKADFSGIDGKRDLYIALINHKAALEVNEEGTEAAAATAAVMMMKSVRFEKPIPEFRADHPFIIMIEEKTTGVILFMGYIQNPSI